jgi:hypothetical protein
VLFGYHHLIVFDFNLQRIENKIARYCEHCTGENWQEIARKLNRIGRWEFEDYIPA